MVLWGRNSKRDLSSGERILPRPSHQVEAKTCDDDSMTPECCEAASILFSG